MRAKKPALNKTNLAAQFRRYPKIAWGTLSAIVVILGVITPGVYWLNKQIVWQDDLADKVHQQSVVNKWQTAGLLRLEGIILKHELSDCNAKHGADCSDLKDQLTAIGQRTTTAFADATKASQP